MAFLDRIFVRQFRALFVKNWIVLSRHPFLNVLRCFILPLLYGLLLAIAQLFFTRPNNFGIGQPAPVAELRNVFDGSSDLVWADGTNGTGDPSPMEIMSHITSGFSERQLNAIRQVPTPADIPTACPQNFNLLSECFAAIAFNSLPTASNESIPINYTILADGGLFHIDVVKHTSDYEKRIMPLQWTVDSAIIELQTGVQNPTPLEWPFTQETNEEQSTKIRLDYVRGLRDLFVLALFICYIGVAYQLSGSFMGERANLLTSHLQAMGLRNSARIISWHVSLSLAYFPAWVIIAILWHFRIFRGTNVGLVLVVHLLLGLSLASWSFFVAAPFGKSPQLAAVAATFFAILFAILALVFSRAGTGGAVLYTILLPPGFYIFAIRCIAGFELHRIPTNALQQDPDNQLILLPIIIAAIIAIFLWPCLAVLLEKWLYDAPIQTASIWTRLFKRRNASDSESAAPPPPADTAISIRNLNKTFRSRWWNITKGDVVALSDLSLDIPKFGIFVLLGSNGAGKSTVLSIVSGLLGRTSGSVKFENGATHLPHGQLGIVPQKNVLFAELTCYQTLRLWSSVKRASDNTSDEDLIQLLKDCDLGLKLHSVAATLSGGQKRKLQLAIGLVGGSKLVLVDECTSGVDPLSRRALWKTLTSVRNERTVVFTTHFLDEADLLGDHIAILATPGKLVAEGSPVSLKSTLGKGYGVQVTFPQAQTTEKAHLHIPHEILSKIRLTLANAAITSSTSAQAAIALNTKDVVAVERVLQMLEGELSKNNISRYDVHGTSLEDIFLGLMKEHGQGLVEHPQPHHVKPGDEEKSSSENEPPAVLALTNGRRRRPVAQALTIFSKRWLIAKRSWLTPVLTIVIAVAGACIPLFFLDGKQQTCVRQFDVSFIQPLYLPRSGLQLPFFNNGNGSSSLITYPPNVTATLGPTASGLRISNIQDNGSFVEFIQQSYRNLSLGGISVGLDSGDSLVAWEASPPGINGPTMLNLASTILYNRALNASGLSSGPPRIIQANYQPFPGMDGGTLNALRWTAFFGATMAAFPAFFALYVSKERRSSVQAMQLSNGLADPVGLWLGHILFDTVIVIILSSIIVVVFATAVQGQFHGLGLFWLVFVLYGITGALFAYCVCLVTESPLAAFATVAAYQVIMFILYVAGYLLTLTYAKTSNADTIITIIHFTLSVIIPVASPLRASFVSINLFSLLCGSDDTITSSSLGSLTKYGGPILYLIVISLVLFAILVWSDSGSSLPRRVIALRKGRRAGASVSASKNGQETRSDVDTETEAVQTSGDPLRVLHVTKTFGGSSLKAVDDVSFGVSQGTVLALLGPNGAGKTTAFNIIRGDVFPDHGDVLIQGSSVIRHPRTARLSLGVCPQFTAIDSQLTVREHLMVYGRLKGLYRGPELNGNVEMLLEATALSPYANRLASKLSGGNQRKLSLAIALIGNPAVVLIDEFSTGIDAKMKRDMWSTLRNVAAGKAVAITTHSMEEASALANKVGIIASQMLAIGSTESLAERHPLYEVHFSCRNREDATRAMEVMASIPGSRVADDVATRFEVPIVAGSEQSLAGLFAKLAERGGFSEFTVERVSLESVFLKVIREHGIKEEDYSRGKKSQWRLC